MGVIVGVMPDDMVVSSEVISTAEKAALKVLEIFSFRSSKVYVILINFYSFKKGGKKGGRKSN